MNKTRTSVYDIVSRIVPVDAQERLDRARVLDWIKGDTGIYRLVPPDVPAQHLAAYVVLVDASRQSVLLLDHVKAGLWVPPGGHVEQDEDPYDTAVRELAEELGTRAAMVTTVASLPLFVTLTETRGAGRHTDVSLWYVAASDEQVWIEPDQREFRGHQWQSYDEVLRRDVAELDPAMHRFLTKLQGRM